MKKSGKKKTEIIIAVIITVSLGIAVAVMFAANHKTVQEIQPTVSVEPAASSPSEETPAPSPAISAVSLTVTTASGWENNGAYSCQLNGLIENNGAEDFSDWEVRIGFTDEVTLESGWNGTYELLKEDDSREDNPKGKRILSVTPVDYNTTVAAGSSAGFGFIVTVASRDDIDYAMQNAVLYGQGGTIQEPLTVDEGTPEPQATSTPQETVGKTPLEIHGALTVKGTDIVDQNGDVFRLKGVSTHGIAWFPEYVSLETFKTFRDNWGANLIRLAMYTAESGGYCTDGDRQALKELVKQGVEYAAELGMYVIIDWHILNDANPLENMSQAVEFFDEMSEACGNYENVLYEICNEPNGSSTWADIKTYAETVIPVIRAHDADAIIIVGTPTWSQDVDIAANDPLSDDHNIMYAVHFYATTHTDAIRSKVKEAHEAGLPIFVSECSICDASGSGAIDYDQAETWFDLLAEYNISYVAWNISNKNETSSLIRYDCTKTSGWSDDELSDTGKWFKKQIRND